MGFTVRFMLGTVLVLLLCSCFETTQLSRPERQIRDGQDSSTDKLQKVEDKKATTEQSIVGNRTDPTIAPKTETSKHIVVNNAPKGDATSSREEIGRSIDIEKYVSKEFHNKNNVYTHSISPDTEKYISPDYFHSTTHHLDETKEFDFDLDLTTPKSAIFDSKYKAAVKSVEQKLEHFDDSDNFEQNPEPKKEVDIEILYQKTKNNDTKSDLSFITFRSIVKNDTAVKNELHKDILQESGSNLSFNSSYNKTVTVDDTDDANNTIPKEDTDTLAKAESSTSKSGLLTTPKSIVLTKPPSNKNSSHISILSNNIETETVKAISATPTTTQRDVSKRGSTKFADYASTTQPTLSRNDIHKEQIIQENQLVEVHVEPPLDEEPTFDILVTSSTSLPETTTTISATLDDTTEATSTPESEPTESTSVLETTAIPISVTFETDATDTTLSSENETTESSSPTETTDTTYKVDFSTTEEPLTTTILETSVPEDLSTTEHLQRTSKDLTLQVDLTESTTLAADTTTATMAPSTTESSRTTNRSTPDETTIENHETTTKLAAPSSPETHTHIYVKVDMKSVNLTAEEETTETPTTTDNDPVTSESFEREPSEDNSGKIAAIVISTVGGVCLIIVAGLLVIMRKRQKRFNYGQRCRPVSLDDYSMDNVSVYNSVRRKGMPRSSKRSYGNPAFEDPSSVSHPLNFPALGKFASNLEDIRAEFEEIPQITAKTNELPDGCDTKNRYANVIPLPESRVYLTPIEGYPNSDYINANYVTGPKNVKGYYIACQAPLQNTVDDFWRMIWEQQCKVVLMMTHLFENGVEKCVDYLPPSEVLDCHRLFGDFQVTLKKREVKDKYMISILQLKNMVSNSWREITHLWYLGWPEKGVPLEANSLIAFLIEGRSYMKSSSLNRKEILNGNINNGATTNELNPVIVHCSPGTGRTGVVIACDIAIREFEQNRLVDIPRIVYKIRRDRASAVQTKEQYAFIYKVVSLYATKLAGGVLDSL